MTIAISVLTHLLGLSLFCIHRTREESCSASGNLTSPQVCLCGSSNDEVVVNCLIPQFSNFSRVILCKDGKVMKTQEQEDKTFSYIFHYNISQDGAGKISCMFQFKDTKNQVKNSAISNSYTVGEVSDHEDSSPYPKVGITVVVILILATVFYLLKKRGIIKCRAIQDQHKPNASTESRNQPSEDYSRENVLQTYEEVASNRFQSVYCQDKAQIAPSPLYNTVNVKRKKESHSASGH